MSEHASLTAWNNMMLFNAHPLFLSPLKINILTISPSPKLEAESLKKIIMPITRIYPHYPKLNPTPPLKRRDQNSPFATAASLKDQDLGPPTKKLAVIETEPILANDFYATTGPRNIDPSLRPRTNENAWSLVDEVKTTYWGHRSVNILGNYQDVLELDKKVHTIMMTILCDRGTHLGVMATNITNNFAHEVKPQQLRHFLNLHVCNLDNNDLFYQYYYENVLMQQPADFLNLNMGIYSPELIGKKRDWIQKWTKAEHRTFAECFIAYTAATMIFDTINTCAADAFESIGVLRSLVEEATSLAKKHAEVLEDFAYFVHNELLIHAASPLSIREIVCDAAEYEFDYAVAITPDENSFIDRSLLFKHIKKNADKTLNILGQPPYFHLLTV
jgi:ribonucleotide reductase beta subunit family protein with ferritin-like domain